MEVIEARPQHGFGCGFVPGGSSLHSIGSAHGPDAATFKAASTAVLEPEKFDGGLAFMFETSAMLQLTPDAADPANGTVQPKYAACWEGLPRATIPNEAELSPAKLSRVDVGMSC